MAGPGKERTGEKHPSRTRRCLNLIERTEILTMELPGRPAITASPFDSCGFETPEQCESRRRQRNDAKRIRDQKRALTESLKTDAIDVLGVLFRLP
ncbi:MAG: hypothetical protein PHV63_01470 [Candidatus Daviesbacteria bacterium]|nr:hypothetical protein [Candidatus Daviesbacteria bacterium]